MPPEILPADWRCYDDTMKLVGAVADLIEERMQAVLSGNNEFHLVFPGGSSVVPVLQNLAQRPLNWGGVNIYLTDERCVVVGDVERNDRLVEDYLLAYIDPDQINFHKIPAELGPAKGAKLFAEQLERYPVFDLVILGIGEDGHTASLFPQDIDQEETQVVAISDAPKPPVERVSLGYERLLSAKERIVLVMGNEKKAIVGRIRDGEIFPVTKAKPNIWFVISDIYA